MLQQAPQGSRRPSAPVDSGTDEPTPPLPRHPNTGSGPTLAGQLRTYDVIVSMDGGHYAHVIAKDTRAVWVQDDHERIVCLPADMTVMRYSTVGGVISAYVHRLRSARDQQQRAQRPQHAPTPTAAPAIR